jgi:SAM-dependent methyltransferase
MRLADIVNRLSSPEPWSEGDNIPWNEPGFSARMLKEHLTQDHDLASRRSFHIDNHVDWIHDRIIRANPSRILDLGCGPGLYASRMARLGHSCTGIDFSPASVDYAKETAARESLDCTYYLADLRTADFGAGYDLAMLIFGELNVFHPYHARAILCKAFSALNPGGKLLLEVSSLSDTERMGSQPSTWFAAPQGLFSDSPHLVLEECFWDAEKQTATIRMYVIDAASGGVTRHAQSLQGYSDAGYTQMLHECGFEGVTFYPALGVESGEPTSLIAIIAKRP